MGQVAMLRFDLDGAGVVISVLILTFSACAFAEEPQLGSARVVFQTNYGDVEFGFYPSVAPITVDHIYKLARLGGYNTNHFFRIDKGFVAQVADVANGRTAPMNEEQRVDAYKTVVGEFSQVKHVRGILSMGRHDDPNSGGSSFSILLGNAPHLDGKVSKLCPILEHDLCQCCIYGIWMSALSFQYAIFGKMTKGDETLRKLEELPTRREGMFVMPTERVTILSTYYYDAELEACAKDRTNLKRRLEASFVEIEGQRLNCFP
ncbi:hypothetical protein QQ045_017903 [Rhodiola kirilowii]